MAHRLVVHCKLDAYDTYIGRGSKWGNPFRIGVHGTREQVIDRYEQWLLDQPELLAELGELYGLRLGCWCAPRRCHGEVLVWLAERAVFLQRQGYSPRVAGLILAAPAPF